jgi:uncharacterized membrane protein
VTGTFPGYPVSARREGKATNEVMDIADHTAAPTVRPAARRNLSTGVLIGIGLVATLDEAVLHQLLDWHHFYDLPSRQGTPLTDHARTAGLLSDGLFHVVATAILVAGVWRLGTAGGIPAALRSRLLWAGVCLGFGGFNLYDATIQHKLLRLHQVRRGVADPLPYDLAFGGAAAAILLLGVWLLTTDRTMRSKPAGSSS